MQTPAHTHTWKTRKSVHSEFKNHTTFTATLKNHTAFTVKLNPPLFLALFTPGVLGHVVCLSIKTSAVFLKIKHFQGPCSARYCKHYSTNKVFPRLDVYMKTPGTNNVFLAWCTCPSESTLPNILFPTLTCSWTYLS